MQRIITIAGVALLFSASAIAEEVAPGILRTPDERFENLPGYDFAPNYVEIDGYRVHYVDEGPRDGEIVFMLHGEPTWSYLYRKMIPVFVEAGYRAIAPDLIGFGKSDKPVSMDTHTYQFHVDTMGALVRELDLQDATFFGQDWGGLIGLRVVTDMPDRFARIVIGNTGLPTGVEGIGDSAAFMQWKAMNQGMIDRGDMPVGAMVAGNVGDPTIREAYDAPFPTPEYKAGALIMPQRVPVTPDDPSRAANEAAWKVLEAWEKPFLTTFSDGDPITRGGEAVFQSRVPGAKGQPHTTIEGAGHFLQEQKGPELAQVIVEFIEATKTARTIGEDATHRAGLMADDIPVAHTPPGYWQEMPPPVLTGCTEALVKGAPDMRGMWEVVESHTNGEPSQMLIGLRQRIEQCGNRVVITAGGVTHDMRCDGTYDNGVNDIGERSTGGRPITVAATFENGVHVLRPKGMPDITVEREMVDGDLIWRYGPALVLRCERVETE